jgi:type III restriction enzyme
MRKKKTVIGYEREIPEVPGRDSHTKPGTFLETRPGFNEVAVIEGRRASVLPLVGKMREAVDAWRDAGYPGASDTTRDLFRWWFEEAATQSDSGFSPYWGQREAVETLVYLVEVAGIVDMQALISTYSVLPPSAYRFQTTAVGVRQVEITGMPEPIDLPSPELPRYAFKMATGSGKTMVMALVITWSYLHAHREVGSPMTDNFLVIAPNVIVFERLRVDFEDLHVFRQRDLVPPGWSLDLRVILRGDSAEPASHGNLIVTNIQQLRDRANDATDVSNPVQALLGKKPIGGSETAGRPVIERVRELDRLLVINDEAHHVHDEDLAWNKTIQGLHRSVPKGLAGWLDFTATPRFRSGAYFPWVVCDYPLAQAVEDGIVKAPMIVRLVDKTDPGAVTGKNLLLKYHDWLVAGVQRLKDHEKAFKAILGARPVMFLMCESIQHADLVGGWLRDKAGGGLRADEVLVIHTDKEGEIRKSDLDVLREAARRIDEAASRIRAVVSVLVLREGWDVRNVTIVLGLRPGTAASRILPEQAVGRGLRLMQALGPDYQQVLEVMGTPSFEEFVKELEAEGVQVPVKTKPPTPPITVQPLGERKKYDVQIPRTGEGLHRAFKKIDGFDPKSAGAVFEKADVTSLKKLKIEIEDALRRIKLGEEGVEVPAPPLGNDVVAAITNRVQEKAGLTMEFAELLPVVKTYLGERAFGDKVDLDAPEVRQFLAGFLNQDKVASHLARLLGELTLVETPLVVQPEPLTLAKTRPFLWRRQRLECTKTVFNYVAVFNPFEAAFAEFLDRVPDVKRFAALAETFTGFWVDYLKPSGAIGRYFPDWVVVQKTSEGSVGWIVETKGRVWPGTEAKDAAVGRWCKEVTNAAGQSWNYIRVNQIDFERMAPGVSTLAELVARLRAPEKPALTLIRGEGKGERLETERDRLPFFSLKAAAGYFGAGRAVEELDHIEVDFPVIQGMFAAKVVGKSMETLIPDGSIALFREYEGGTRDGKVVLVQSDDLGDPETGGSYTVKRFWSKKEYDADGRITRTEIRLEPENPDFQSIVLTPDDDADVQVLAVFEEVLIAPEDVGAGTGTPA